MEEHLSLRGGYVRLREEGAQLFCEARCENDGRGLYHLQLCGARGSYDLGALLPEQGMLLLSRRVPKAQLAAAGALPVVAAQLQLQHRFGGSSLPAGWQKEPQPGQHFPQDALLRAQVAALGGALLYRGPVGFSLAFPFQTRRPFPLPVLFCFARIRRLGEGDFAVFSFDEAARPRIL